MSAVLVAAGTLLAAGAGCDRANVIENPGRGLDADFQGRAVRTRLTLEGVTSLFDVSHPEGLSIDRAPKKRTYRGSDVTVGPVAQSVPLDDIDVSVQNARLDLTLATGQTDVTIPVRTGQGVGKRVCRFRLRAANWTVQASARDDKSGGWNLDVTAPPTFTPTRLRIEKIGDCPELLDDGEVPSKLSQVLTNYLKSAVDAGVRAFVDVPVYEKLGLLQRRIALQRVSSFVNRRGRLSLAGAAPKSGGIALNGSGLTADLDVAASFERAGCAAPVTLPETGQRPAGSIDGGDIRSAGGELGLAISSPLVERLAQSAVMAGFACRGLDPATSGGDIASFEREQLRLQTVGLADAPVSGPFRAAISPGSPPDLELQPGADAVELHWDGLTLEFYGTRAGAPLRLMTFTTTAIFTLRPAGSTGSSLPFEIRSVSVDRSQIDSPWQVDPPGGSETGRWTRRLLLITFEDLFNLPLPVDPEAPLEATGSRVRSSDLLILLRFQSQ